MYQCLTCGEIRGVYYSPIQKMMCCSKCGLPVTIAASKKTDMARIQMDSLLKTMTADTHEELKD